MNRYIGKEQSVAPANISDFASIEGYVFVGICGSETLMPDIIKVFV
jgi:hypothetical protein